jgi:benzoyl-CoA reductase subunit C
MQIIQQLRQVSADPMAYARRWKAQTNGTVIGTLCSYAPEELLLAAGALGFRVIGSRASIVRADAHLQAYCCSLVRSCLEDALSGSLDFLDGAVFPHTCDSMQRLSDIWRMAGKTGFHLDMVLPVKLNTPSARDYMRAVMQKARHDLATALGKPITDADLRQASDTCNAIRTAMQRLYAIRRQRPGAIAGSDLQAILRASMVMDRHDFLDSLVQVVDRLDLSSPTVPHTGKRLFLSGGLCNLPDLYDLIEAAGGSVVGDDLCTGMRAFDGLVETNGEPMAAITERYLQRAVCPAKHAGINRRANDLVRLVAESRAQGVIFLFLKFCDPHAFDYPYLRARLDEAGIPSLLVELEEHTAADGQLRTRVEAFMEMLSAG